MSISLYKIKKWTNMLLGNSVYHVNQDEGKAYSTTEVLGYYNNLTEKITRFGMNCDSVPKTYVDSGEEIYFSIAIFQYGLAAYDLYLINQEETMLGKLRNAADWAIRNQQKDGSWLTFQNEDQEHPYSSMAQGEAISMLVRAHKVFLEEKYILAAKKAKDFMIQSIEQGGTTLYKEDKPYFYEFTHKPQVLNGWIFSAWGIYDYAKYFDDDETLNIWNKTISALSDKLPTFDNGYWSKYDDKNKIASPFYHKLHIAQLNVLYELTGNSLFKEYADKWVIYQKRGLNRGLAFFVKAIQKIID